MLLFVVESLANSFVLDCMRLVLELNLLATIWFLHPPPGDQSSQPRISRIQRRCLATTLVAWKRTTQRRHRAGPAASKLMALARQGRARRVLRDWLLATARQAMERGASVASAASAQYVLIVAGASRTTVIT